MSGAILLDQVVARVRGAFTRAELASVQPYGGEFNAAEIPFKSYSCPAIFVTVLGWQPADADCRLSGRHANKYRVAAFVAFKDADRNKRLMGAMRLAERLAVCMRQWAPMQDAANADQPYVLGGLEGDASAENLYSRTLDAAGQALWLVDWHQCLKPLVPPEQLYDLLAVDIHDKTLASAPAPAPAPAPGVLVVTDDVTFTQP